MRIFFFFFFLMYISVVAKTGTSSEMFLNYERLNIALSVLVPDLLNPPGT